MAHRVLDFTRRHHGVVARQFPNFPGLGDDNNEDTVVIDPTTTRDSFPSFPSVNIPGLDDSDETTTTSTYNGPTVGPIIPTVGDSFTSDIESDSPVLQTTTGTTTTLPPTTAAPTTPSTSSTPATTAQPVAASVNLSTTTSLTATRSLTSSAASSTSPTPSPTGGSSNVGPIIGGIAAGLAGVVVIIFALTYFIRKRRNAQYEKDAFDASQFRRSAVLMDDPPTHEDTVVKGFNPPMTQHNGGYGGPGPVVSYGNIGRDTHDHLDAPNAAGFGAANRQVSGWDDMSTAGSTQPFFGAPNMSAPQGFQPQSPISAYDSGYNHAGPQPSVQMVGDHRASELTRESSVTQVAAYPAIGVAVSRRSSVPESPSAQYASYPGQENNNQDDYIDMNRTSVTPFQAAQYKIISNKLNAPVPTGLPTPLVEEQVQRMSPPAIENNNLSMVSPFDDPANRPISAASETNTISDFPAPPPALYSPGTGRRIDSTPPMLPEIHVQSRITSMNVNAPDSFPVSPSPLALGFDPSVTGHSPVAPSFIVQQGPMSSNGHDNGPQTFPTNPSADHSSFGHAPLNDNSPAPPLPTAKKEGKRETLYDPEDAYGGM